MLRLLAAVLALAVAAPALAQEVLVIAHRGASGERPEHTLAAYERAIDQGADYIEPDLVVTKDLVLVARHENELSDTTDVASREEFDDRKRSKTIDGRLISGWFAEDFTLAELRTLRAKERMSGIRPANARFDGLYGVPTFAEIVQLGPRQGSGDGTHHRTVSRAQILDLPAAGSRDRQRRFAGDCAAAKRTSTARMTPIFVQSFEIAPLQRLNRLTDVKLVQLVQAGEGPADEPALTYADMVTPTGLADIATYADAIGADIRLVLTDDGASTGLVRNASAAGLPVHAWTLREENAFMPMSLQIRGGDPTAGCADVVQERLVQEGVAGIFTDSPGPAVRRRDTGWRSCSRAWLPMPGEL